MGIEPETRCVPEPKPIPRPLLKVPVTLLVDEDDILRVHQASLIEAVQRAAFDPVHGLGSDDNPVFPGMHHAAAHIVGASIEAFRDYYETRHAPLALTHGASMSRYVRRYLEPQPHAESGTCDELPYDVITELWFDDEATFRGVLRYITTSVMPDDVVADELELFDRPTMRIATVVESETDLSPWR